MARPRLVPCACGAEMVRPAALAEVDEVRGAVVHVEEFAGSLECAHAAGACVRHSPGLRLPWVEVSVSGVVSESAGCPDWARGYMREGWVTR